jgi:hypothetical protein
MGTWIVFGTISRQIASTTCSPIPLNAYLRHGARSIEMESSVPQTDMRADERPTSPVNYLTGTRGDA